MDARVRAVLEARARLLARPPRAPDHQEYLQVVVFAVGDERFAVETGYVSLVHRLRTLTPLPCTPGFVVGVTNVRGRVRTVVDLGAFFGRSGRGLEERAYVVLLEGGKNEMGILVDVVEGVQSVAVSDLEPSLVTLTGARERLLRGVRRDSLVVLDGGRLLTDEELKVDQHAAR